MSIFKKKNQGQIILSKPINMHWDVEDPFTFVSHHEDDYPEGNSQQAPPLSEIAGRDLGRDYDMRFGFRMYHGKVVPGFPAHAHWGYETITIPEKGYVDHFDNLGNQGRYGFGDVQWLTASSRYQHCEMYPLTSSEKRNPNDITQIMMNLPMEKKNKDVTLNTIWSENVPTIENEDYSVKIIAGEFNGKKAIIPNKDSWAADESHHVRILRISIDAGRSMTLPAVSSKINRNLYAISGSGIKIEKSTFTSNMRFKLPGDQDVTFTNGVSNAVLWLLEGEPINEKQTTFGPVILNNDKDVRDALDEIRKKQYEDWPWDVIDKAQPKGTDRFIRYADGREERP